MADAPLSSDEALRRARASVDAGDVAAARRFARLALEGAPAGDVATGARDLLRDTDVAWPVLVYGLVALLVLVGVVLLTVARSAHP